MKISPTATAFFWTTAAATTSFKSSKTTSTTGILAFRPLLSPQLSSSLSSSCRTRYSTCSRAAINVERLFVGNSVHGSACRREMTSSMANGDGMSDNNNSAATTNGTPANQLQDTPASTPASTTTPPLPMNQPSKVHTVTVCMVPPPEEELVWDVVSQMRKQLQDPGYFRWPPHVNLLYPFLQLRPTPPKEKNKNQESGADNDDYDNEDVDTNNMSLEEIVQRLDAAVSNMAPFHVHLNRFGTFGGKNRGVLWLHPESSYDAAADTAAAIAGSSSVDNDNNGADAGIIPSPSPPLIALQQALEAAFPMCQDQSQKGGEQGRFVPHMTISHFSSRDEALEAQADVQQLLLSLDESGHHPLTFLMDRIYLLERKGDKGQFLRVADIFLGTNNPEGSSSTLTTTTTTTIFNSPRPFPAMPQFEEDWVYEERMKMKERRRNGNRGGRGSRRGRGTRPRTGSSRSTPRVPDTPEVIAAKRAERKAKREQMLDPTTSF